MKRALLIVAGPSAVGKTTVMSELLRLDPTFSLSRSVTTRIRRGDAFDAEYEYLTKDEFDERKGELIEYTDYGTHCYGTPRIEIERIFASGDTPLLILDLNGVVSVKGNTADHLEPFVVYIWDELSVMDHRLRARRDASADPDEAEKTYEKRKAANISDYIRLAEIADSIDLLIRNSGSASDTAARILEAFECFKRGELPAREEIALMAERLSRSALDQ